LKEILGNVSTTVCFQVSREDALKFSREFVTEYNGEILTVPEEEILRLKVGQAWCKMGRSAFLMHTYLAPGTTSSGRAAKIMQLSRRNFGRALPSPPPKLAAAAGDPGAGRKAADPLADLDPGKVF